MFDNNRLRSELAHIQRALGNVAASPRGKGMLDELRKSTRGTSAARLWQALYADCMRIVYAAVAADGVIDDHELEAFHDMLSAAARSYADTLTAEYAELIVVDLASAHRFVALYADDGGPFGKGAAVPWPGLALCRRASEIGDGAALAQYERTMTWLIAEACRIGRVTTTDPRCQGRLDELDQLRRSLARNAVVDAPGLDLRVRAFLSPTWVFTAVQQASSVFENDPFDIESIHRHARDSFERLIEVARMPTQIAGGRMLLVLGDSGGGKTHLLRDFRRQVQENGRGFVVYAQLQSNSNDYERYLLQHFVDSLGRPYSTASGERTGLRELASGIVRLVSSALQVRVQQLIEGTWDGASVHEFVNELVDKLLREGKFATFDKDLLRVLLYALCPDPCITASVYKYLRCEDMNPHDRNWIGGVIPRTGADHPHRMFCELGRLAAMTQRALVVMLDQVDLSGFEQSSNTIFRHAIDALYKITSEISSAVAVVACLKDLYQAVRGVLNQPAIDRLEKNPPIAWLESNCSYPEIEEVVSRRLQWLFDSHGAVFRPEQPIYPIPEDQLRELDNRRLRDVLQWCHEFQTRCAITGKVLGDGDGGVIVEPKRTEEDLDLIAAQWNDEAHAEGIDIPTDDGEILEMVGAAARACAAESGMRASAPVISKELLRVNLSAGDETEALAIMVTNRNYHGGAFTGQIESLRRRARNAVAVAVRTLEFPRGEACDRAISQLVKDGGRRALLDASTLRTLVAFQRFRPPFPEDRVLAWRRRDRPISSSPIMVALFGLERLRAALPIDALASAPEPASESSGVVVAAAVDVETALISTHAIPAGLEGDGGSRPTSKRATTTPPAAAPKRRLEPQLVPVPPLPSRLTPPSMQSVEPPSMLDETEAGLPMRPSTPRPRAGRLTPPPMLEEAEAASATRPAIPPRAQRITPAPKLEEAEAAPTTRPPISPRAQRLTPPPMLDQADAAQVTRPSTPARVERSIPPSMLDEVGVASTTNPAIPPRAARVTPPPMPAVEAPPVLHEAEARPVTRQPKAAPVAEPAASPRGSMPDLPVVGLAPGGLGAAAPIGMRPRSPMGTQPPAIDANEVWVGNSPAFDAEPRVLEVGALLAHMAIVGDERSTNATLALNLVEQLVARDVAVIVVDRKGDLAGHAQPDWWQRAADPERARALAAKLDVRLFTPGHAAGCPLALSVVPDLANVAEQERDRVVQRAARGLAAIMRLGEGTADAARLAVLSQALAVLAGRGARGGLAELIALIDQQDDALVARTARAGRYDDALFKRLVEELQSVQVSDGALFDPAAETLSVETLVGGRTVGKTPLAIVNTQTLGEAPRVQAWIAHLLGCLARQPHARNELRTVLMLDEAELFLPVGGKAASKEPMQELLKLPRSAGLGVVLMSQRPAELDYRSRELIHTWFLGRISDAKTNDRLNPLFDRLPPIRSKLSGLERSRFVMMQERSTLDLERAPSLLRSESLAEPELIALAAANRLPARRATDEADRGAVGRAGAPTSWAH